MIGLSSREDLLMRAMRIVAVILFTAGAISKIGFAAESVDQLYASLAKLPAEQRAKRIEEVSQARDDQVKSPQRP